MGSLRSPGIVHAPPKAFEIKITNSKRDIRTKDQICQVADPNQIASLVLNGAGGTITTCDPAKQPLLAGISFNAGCAVGMSGVGSFSAVSTRYGNGPGQTTNGFDI